MKTAIKNVEKIGIALLLMVFMGLSTTASASPILLSYLDGAFASDCAQNSACTQAADVVGSDLALVSGNGVSGYTNLSWSSFGLASNQAWDFTMTVSNDFFIDGFGLDFFNNDCQTGGAPFCTPPADWAVKVSKNGGAFNQFLSFTSGPPGPINSYDAGLGIALTSGDTLNFQLFCTSDCYSPVGTGQYVATNIHVNGIAAVPETASILVFMIGLIGLFGSTASRSNSRELASS